MNDRSAELSNLPPKAKASGAGGSSPAAPASATSFPGRPRNLLAGGGLILLILLAYWPLVHGGFLWDDAMLKNNPWLQHWSALGYIWGRFTGEQYYPVVYTTLFLQFKLWALNPLGYHLVNLALQAASTLLLWRILVRLELKGAWIVAAIWAIHPVQVETVGWIIEQKNLLSGLFYFAAALTWLRFAGIALDMRKFTGLKPGELESGGPRTLSQRCDATETPASRFTGLKPGVKPGVSQMAWYILATLFYVLALLSKTDVCTLPAVLLLLIWWKRGRLVPFPGKGFIGRRIGRWRYAASTLAHSLLILPWFLLSAVMAWITVHVEHSVVGAQGASFDYSIPQRLLLAGKVLWFYPWKLFWPHPLLLVYPRWNIHALGGWQWLYPLAALAVPVLLFLWRRRIGRGPFMAVAFYGLTIAPVLGFISFYLQVYSFVGDHLQYLACLGLIALVVEGFWFLVSGFRWKSWFFRTGPETGNQKPENLVRIAAAAASSPRPRVAASPCPNHHRFSSSVAIICGGIVLVVLGAVTWKQSRLYAASIHVWEHVLQYYPDCPLALEHVGVYLGDHEQEAQGIFLLRRAVKNSAATPTLRALFNSNIADLYWQHYQNYPAAVHYYQLALRSNPHYLYAIQRIVRCYEELGDWPQVVADLKRGLQEFPDSGALHEAWADVLTFAPQAIAQAVAGGGGRVATRGTTTNSPQRTQRDDDNRQDAKIAKKIDHGLRRDTATRRAGYREAVRQYQLAIYYDPYTPSAYYNLAVVLQRLGLRRQADVVLKHLGTLAPRTLILIAHGHERLGDVSQAVADLHWELRSFPQDAALHAALGHVLLAQHQDLAALEQYRLAVREQPENAPALYNLAVTLQNLGRWREALTFYQRTVRVAPRWVRAYYSYGECLWNHGQTAAANAQFTRMRQVGPRAATAYIGQAAAMATLGDNFMELEFLRAGLRRFPHSAPLHLALANSLARQRQYLAAETEYQLALRYRPHDSQALANLALTLEKLGQWQNALPYYQQALRLAPRWARGHYMYGQCLLAHGQAAAAAVQFQWALQWLPAGETVNRAMAQRALAQALRELGGPATR